MRLHMIRCGPQHARQFVAPWRDTKRCSLDRAVPGLYILVCIRGVLFARHGNDMTAERDRPEPAIAGTVAFQPRASAPPAVPASLFRPASAPMPLAHAVGGGIIGAGTGVIGALGEVTSREITGWAFIPGRPDAAVVLDLLVDGALAIRFACDTPRAGGEARHGFSIATPAMLLDGRPHQISLVPTNSTAPLPGSPCEVVLAPASPMPTVAPVGVAPGRMLALAVFAALLRREVAPRVLAGLTAPDMPPMDLPGHRTLGGDWCGGAVRIEDAWLADDAHLMLRVEADGPQGMSIVAFQGEIEEDEAGGGTQTLGFHPIQATGSTLFRAPLLNCFAPILLLVQDAANEVLGTTLLPFPSLCRGGAHAGEVAALGAGGHRFQDLCEVSDALLRDAVGEGLGTAPHSLAGIAIALTGADGTEPFFSEAFQSWLQGMVGVRVEALADDGGTPPELRAHLEATLQPRALPNAARASMTLRVAEGEVVLHLPPDALPCLSAIFSRRLGPGAAPVILAQAGSGRPAWCMNMPLNDAMLAALQPRGILMPMLVGAGAAPGQASRAVAVPIAIRFLSLRRPSDAALMFPTAPDSTAPLLRTSLGPAELARLSVTAVLPAHLPAGAALAFLGALRTQHGARGCDILALAAAGPRRDALAEALARDFPQRSTLLDPAGMNPNAAVNMAAAQARGRYLLLVNDAVLMTDQRTLEALATLLLDPRAATAGCGFVTEIEARGRTGTEARGRTTLHRHMGGLFPARMALTTLPHWVFEEPVGPLPLPPATYPVVANPFRLALVRAEAWHGLGGMDARRFPTAGADLDFALRGDRKSVV